MTIAIQRRKISCNSGGNFHRDLRGGENFTSLCQVLQTLYIQSVKSTLSYLKICTGAPRQAPLEIFDFLTCRFAVVTRSCKSRHFTVVGSQLLQFGSRCECDFSLSTMARWRSRHFTVVTTLGPRRLNSDTRKS